MRPPDPVLDHGTRPRDPLSLKLRLGFLLVLAHAVVGAWLMKAASPEQNDILYTSLSGAMQIQQIGENAWIVSTKDPTQRAELPPLEGISSFDDEYHSSPDDTWVFGVREIAHGFSSGDLYRLANPQHVEIVFSGKDKSFNEQVWLYCVKQGALKANYAAEQGGADTGLTKFTAWGIDSVRLLVRLTGGDRHKALHSCYVYFNTRKKTFEITDYLRKLNRTTSAILACAEPVDSLAAETALKTRLTELDRRLNSKYTEVLAKTDPDRVSVVREAQHNWLKERDAGAKLYIDLFPGAEKESRRLQFLGDVTAARIEVPTEEWEL